MPAERPRILIIEDNRALAVGLDLNLSAEGYRVLITGDGDSGLRQALEERPDLIVLDLMLPGLDGYELLRELRERGRDMPVIILSARNEENDKVKGLLDGADDYVTKPFSMAELSARIVAAMRHHRRTKLARFGDIEVDRTSRTAQRRGEAVTLTPREFDLLLYFMDHPRQVHPRDQLLAALWGLDYEGTARTIDNFVRNLRLKLEPDAARPRHFTTVHGVGYRFDP